LILMPSFTLPVVDSADKAIVLHTVLLTAQSDVAFFSIMLTTDDTYNYYTISSRRCMLLNADSKRAILAVIGGPPRYFVIPGQLFAVGKDSLQKCYRFMMVSRDVHNLNVRAVREYWKSPTLFLAKTN
jgi:hypothetical protein